MKQLSLFVFLLVVPTVASAQRTPTVVSLDSVKETAVRYKGKRERVFCVNQIPGSIRNQTAGVLFTPFSYSLSKTSKRKRTQYDRLKYLVRAGRAQCLKIPLTPTPTPTPSAGNFDLSGNVTDAGKLLFGIPSQLSANVSLGRDFFNRTCTGCHTEKTGRSFSEYRSAIANSPMLFDSTQVPDADLANLVAYLNRFRQ